MVNPIYVLGQAGDTFLSEYDPNTYARIGTLNLNSSGPYDQVTSIGSGMYQLDLSTGASHLVSSTVAGFDAASVAYSAVPVGAPPPPPPPPPPPGEYLAGVDTTSNHLSGGPGADIIQGGALDDELHGLGGNDVLLGLGGNDLLFGEDGNDTIYGGDGIDRIDGGAGADTMYGGTGDDIYYVDDSSDQIIENANEGRDYVYASVRYTLPDNVEGLIFNGHDNITGIGNALGNDIVGNVGNNVLNGLAGDDSLQGSSGNDTIHGNEGRDVIDGGADNDTLYGDDGDDSLHSGSGDDVLHGGTGNDTLYGEGAHAVLYGEADNDTLKAVGFGTIVMYGGTGNDNYYVVSAKDQVFENPGEGHDGVNVSIAGGSYVLPDNVEDLVLGGTTVGGTGNALANLITGNAGDNVITGGGGSDHLIGGAGADRFYYAAPSDSVGGAADWLSDFQHGVDKVDLSAIAVVDVVLTAEAYQGAQGTLALIHTQSGRTVAIHMAGQDTLADFILPGNTVTNTITGTANADVLIGTNGNDAIHGLGGNDVLIGGDGNDTLDGGTGADSMAGGKGDDIYYVDNASDLVVENPGEGYDTVYTTIANYVAPANIEKVVYAGGGASMAAMIAPDSADARLLDPSLAWHAAAHDLPLL